MPCRSSCSCPSLSALLSCAPRRAPGVQQVSLLEACSSSPVPATSCSRPCLAGRISLPPQHPALTQAPDVRAFLAQQHVLKAGLQDSSKWQRTYLGKGQSANYRSSQQKSACVSADHTLAAYCYGPEDGTPALYVWPLSRFRMPWQHTYKCGLCSCKALSSQKLCD